MTAKSKTALEIKINLVRAGKSEVFNNWAAAGITEEQFIEGLRWLCEDPCDSGSCGTRITRELGADEKGKRIVRLQRYYNEDGSLGGYYDIDAPARGRSRWEGKVTFSCRDRI